ncbi:hypothetical protein L596_014391 [Steinernema carpocapsae]|uniref:Uncharacterized protein n=2 Tax=Steinernema carpocapsae TaxID=34508 RepID=A0A4U5NCW1_STECR|nr:hypothetical protein L596_014391 [Steinernema carpocapsae]
MSHLKRTNTRRARGREHAGPNGDATQRDNLLTSRRLPESSFSANRDPKSVWRSSLAKLLDLLRTFERTAEPTLVCCCVRATTMADQKDGKGSDQLDVDITTNDKVILAEGAKMDRPPPPDYARSNPGTASTYQRVEKGTKTALMYFEGWLNLNDAKEAKDDDYFGGEGGSEKDKKGKKVVRLVSLQTGAGPNGKNWSYGPNGEVIYHRTGFVGLFDKKPDPAKSHMSNVKSAYASQVVYLNKAPTPVSSGPSVGTHHDLMKGPSSGYIDVLPQADGSRRSHTGNTGSAVSTYHDLSKGNKSAYMHAQSQVGAPRPVSPAGPSVGNQNDLMKGTRSSYMDVQQSPTRSGAAKGSQRDHTGLHKLPQYVKNWSYGANGRIIYHKTGFVGYFDKKPPSQRTGNSVMSTVVGGQSQMIDPNGKSTYGSNQKQGMICPRIF